MTIVFTITHLMLLVLDTLDVESVTVDEPTQGLSHSLV